MEEWSKIEVSVYTRTGWQEEKVSIEAKDLDWDVTIESLGYSIGPSVIGSQFDLPEFSFYGNNKNGTYFVDVQLVGDTIENFIIQDGVALLNFFKEYIYTRPKKTLRFVEEESPSHNVTDYVSISEIKKIRKLHNRGKYTILAFVDDDDEAVELCRNESNHTAFRILENLEVEF